MNHLPGGRWGIYAPALPEVLTSDNIWLWLTSASLDRGGGGEESRIGWCIVCVLNLGNKLMRIPFVIRWYMKKPLIFTILGDRLQNTTTLKYMWQFQLALPSPWQRYKHNPKPKRQHHTWNIHVAPNIVVKSALHSRYLLCCDIHTINDSI
jgi:hypothetical protein